MPRRALLTHDSGAEEHQDRDLPVLGDALTASGARAEIVAWDDERADRGAYDLAVLRSTWNRTRRAAQFLEWAERCAKATRPLNPLDVVRRNTDKRFPGGLAAAGVPVVPTRHLAPGDPVELPDDREYVVTPTSGAGARCAARHTPDACDEAARHVEPLHAEGLTAMVQPYMRRVDDSGERSPVHLGGRLLHATRRRAAPAPGVAFDAERTAHPGVAPWQATDVERALAAQALAAVPGSPEPLYSPRGPRRRRPQPTRPQGTGAGGARPVAVPVPGLGAGGGGGPAEGGAPGPSRSRVRRVRRPGTREPGLGTPTNLRRRSRAPEFLRGARERG